MSEQSNIIDEQNLLIAECKETLETLKHDMEANKDEMEYLKQADEEQRAAVEENKEMIEALNDTIKQQKKTIDEKRKNIETLSAVVEAIGDRLDHYIKTLNSSEYSLFVTHAQTIPWQNSEWDVWNVGVSFSNTGEIGFYAVLTTYQVIEADKPLIFNSLLINEGNGWVTDGGLWDIVGEVVVKYFRSILELRSILKETQTSGKWWKIKIKCKDICLSEPKIPKYHFHYDKIHNWLSSRFQSAGFEVPHSQILCQTKICFSIILNNMECFPGGIYWWQWWAAYDNGNVL